MYYSLRHRCFTRNRRRQNHGKDIRCQLLLLSITPSSRHTIRAGSFMIQRGIAWKGFSTNPWYLDLRRWASGTTCTVCTRRMVLAHLKIADFALAFLNCFPETLVFVDASTEKGRTDTTMSCDLLIFKINQHTSATSRIQTNQSWFSSDIRLPVLGEIKQAANVWSTFEGLPSKNKCIVCSQHGFPCPKEHLRYRWHLRGCPEKYYQCWSNINVGRTFVSCVVPLTFEFVVVFLWRQ